MKVNPKKGSCGGSCGNNSCGNCGSGCSGSGQHNCGSGQNQKKKSIKSKHTPAFGPYALLGSHSPISVRKIILNVVDEQTKKQVQSKNYNICIVCINNYAFVFNPKGYSFSVLVLFNSNFQTKCILSWCKECQIFHIGVARNIVFDDTDIYNMEVEKKIEEMKKGNFNNT